MTLTFVTNLVHHHQLPVADEFYRLLGNNYRYIATQPLPDWLIKGGYDPTLDRPYIVRTYLSDEEMDRARKMIDESDVVIMGDAPSLWADKRNKEGKVTFYCTERIYKKGIPWLKLPWHIYVHYKKYGRYKNTYLLCASAYAASDFAKTFCFKGKSFKWGYMTAVVHDSVRKTTASKEFLRIMWCSRFLKWKHPELPILLAARLRDKGYCFIIDMFGGGEEFGKCQTMIKDLGLEEFVHLCGNCPNSEILKEMQEHDLFLFTSDRNEGWGAVLNESMSSGCVPVASDEIGSVPFLIKNGINGLFFKSCDLNSFEKAVLKLFDFPESISLMSQTAISTISDEWSPKVAAENFLDLVNHILNGALHQYRRMEGPASWA